MITRHTKMGWTILIHVESEEELHKAMTSSPDPSHAVGPRCDLIDHQGFLIARVSNPGMASALASFPELLCSLREVHDAAHGMGFQGSRAQVDRMEAALKGACETLHPDAAKRHHHTTKGPIVH